MITKTCRICNQPYNAKSCNSMYCDSCRKSLAKSRQKIYAQRFKSTKKRKKKIIKKSIWEMTREMEEYNRKNKTCLTYGQYVAMVEGD